MEKVGRNLKEKRRRKRAQDIYAEERVARSARASGRGNWNERRKMGEKEGLSDLERRGKFGGETRRRQHIVGSLLGKTWKRRR